MLPILKMVYATPAKRLFDALPIGNGHAGAFFHGIPVDEVLQLNESTFWSGDGKKENLAKGAKLFLRPIRQALFKGKRNLAEMLAFTFLRGKKGNFGTNLPFGKILLHCHPSQQEAKPIEHYERSLVLNHAIGEVNYEIAGVTFRREYFASNPSNVVVIHLSASRPNSVSFRLDYETIEEKETIGQRIKPIAIGTDALQYTVPAREHMHSDGNCGVIGNMLVKVVASGGIVRNDSDVLHVEQATDATIFIAIKTDFRGLEPRQACNDIMEKAVAAGYEKIKRAHVADFSRIFDRVELNLDPAESGPDAADIMEPKVLVYPVLQLRTRFKDGEYSPAFIALLFQYGRYLLQSSSRANSTLPALLQGVFNDNQACRMGWTNDYHLDINTEMNYWPAESCNLPECTPPLHEFLKTLSHDGEKTAKALYGCKGWVAHTVTNAWGFTAPGWHIGWGLHPTGGAWLALQLWEHYAYSLDKEFLATVAYPILKNAAEFFIDYLVPHPALGWLVAGPSNSPENPYRDEHGRAHVIDMGVTCDRVLIHDILRYCIAAAKVLNQDAEFRATLESTLSKLSPLQIGKNGRLQEWLQDYEDAVPNHRHTSHLIALYPSDQITPLKTPELSRAARQTIDLRRAEKNWEGTGWSYGNFLGYYARLGDGESAHADIVNVITKITAPNGFMCHPALAGAEDYIYELDGNTGFTSGVAEMLLQSHADEIHVLPALPNAWTDGFVTGLRARGAFVVDITWNKGKLVQVKVCSVMGATLSMRYQALTRTCPTKENTIYVFNDKLDLEPAN